MNEELALIFEKEMREICKRAKEECMYNPTRFLQMINQYGGVETAKRLIKNGRDTGEVSDGFTTLYIINRLDLTMEYIDQKTEYSELFTLEEIEYCKRILEN